MSLIKGHHMPGVVCHKCGNDFDKYDPRIEWVRINKGVKCQCIGECGQPLNIHLLGEAERPRVVAYEEWRETRGEGDSVSELAEWHRVD